MSLATPDFIAFYKVSIVLLAGKKSSMLVVLDFFSRENFTSNGLKRARGKIANFLDEELLISHIQAA